MKYNSKIKQHAILGVASQSHIWIVCCATLLCSSASKNFWVLGALHLYEKRCRTLLRGGELSSTVNNQYMKRLNIRNLNGVSVSTKNPPLNIPQIMGYWNILSKFMIAC